jgi:hypothetical protein
MREYWVVRWSMEGPHVTHTEQSQGFSDAKDAHDYLDAIIKDDADAEAMADPSDRGRFRLVYALDHFVFENTERFRSASTPSHVCDACGQSLGDWGCVTTGCSAF